MAKIEIKSVDDYIAAQPEPTARALELVRSAIRKGLPKSEEVISYTDGNRSFGERHHAVTIFADQLFTNAPKRSSALEKLSPAAAKPRRKCEGTSKQSPGASRIPCSVAAWQNRRSLSPLTSQGNTVMPPCGGIQPSTSRWSAMKRSRSLRLRVAASCVFPSTTSRLRIAISERISPVVVLQMEK